MTGQTDQQPRRLTNWEIAVLVLADLGGAHTSQHTEDIAAKCYELESQRFRWKKYDFPSLDAVKQALSDARRDRHGGLISGSARTDLWRLTPAGVTWAEQHRRRGLTEAGRLRLEDQRALDQFIEHPSFLSWQSSESPPGRHDAAMLLHLLPDAPVRAITSRVDQLRTIARQAGRDDVERYLQWLQDGVDP